MERIFGHAGLPDHLRGGVIALGNFDGFHLGHRAVVGRAVAQARAAGLPALVGTFDPHPARFFKPDLVPMALTTIPQRLDLFEAAGVDAAVVWSFDARLADMTADAFVAAELATRLSVSGVVTGGDFVFGRGRSGDAARLAALGPTYGFTAQAVDPVSADDTLVSSTRIRAALRDARPGEAAALMGRPFAIRGEVIHGAKLGRQLGFPTANQRLGDYVRSTYGVYAVRVTLPGGESRDGVANLGIRPMFVPPVELLETWILNWSGDLYGQQIDVALVAYLRGELRFDDLDALKTQVLLDCDAAREVLSATQ